MRIYTESNEEVLRAREFLTQWKADRDLSEEQCARLLQETPSELRTTNVFLRLVLLFFTLVGVAAAVALFFVVAGVSSSHSGAGILFLIFAALSYTAAEFSATHARLYRHGVEEALGISSVALLCAGVGGLFSGDNFQSAHNVLLLISAVGVASALWLWHRFGLWYAFPAAMIFAVFLPSYWTSHPAQRVFLCLVYAAGLIAVATLRSRHRFDYLERRYSLAEAFLWLGLYLVLNLKLSAIDTPAELFISTPSTLGYSRAFYWTTWVLLWCLPPLILTRGARTKDRFVLAVGMLTTVLTLVTNKPYLGWQRHTWDPMLLGVALTAVAVFLRRWLAQGPDGVRHGFTAATLSAKHKHAMGVASAVFGLLTPHAIAPAPEAPNPEFNSGFGGDSGGGGASGDF